MADVDHAFESGAVVHLDCGHVLVARHAVTGLPWALRPAGRLRCPVDPSHGLRWIAELAADIEADPLL